MKNKYYGIGLIIMILFIIGCKTEAERMAWAQSQLLTDCANTVCSCFNNPHCECRSNVDARGYWADESPCFFGKLDGFGEGEAAVCISTYEEYSSCCKSNTTTNMEEHCTIPVRFS